MSEHETSKNNSSWGGARDGAGRPKGSENEETKQRRIAESHMKKRIVESTDALLNAQMSLAKGESSLYHIHYEGSGKERRKVVEIVTDQDTIAQFLADTLDTGDDEYYYIATKTPDPRSIDSLLDRTYGKATVNISNPDGTLTPTVVLEGVYGHEPRFRPGDQASETDDMAKDSSQQPS